MDGLKYEDKVRRNLMVTAIIVRGTFIGTEIVVSE